jgi:di/tripeptidase
MRDIHTVHEWLRVGDMVRTADVIVAMLRLHAAV